MSLSDEFDIAKKQIDKLFVLYKANSDSYKTIGMIDEYDALRIIDGSIKIIRKTLENIAKDYHLKEKDNKKIAAFLDSIRNRIENEVLGEEIIIHNYGVYKNKYGHFEEKTIDEASREFAFKAKERLNIISTQKMRIENYKNRKNRNYRKEQLSIILSILAVIISLLTLILK